MSVVCRVRLTGVFRDRRAIAPYVPLPRDHCESHSTPATTATDPLPLGPDYIIKLYDRRSCENVRAEYDHGMAYSEAKARAYQKYLAGEPVHEVPHEFREMPGLSGFELRNGTDMGLFEAWLESEAERTRVKEIEVYNLLADLQGHVVPSLFDTVSVITVFRFPHESKLADGPMGAPRHQLDVSIDAEDHPDFSDFVDRHKVKGILLEYVPGLSLRNFVPSLLDSPLPKHVMEQAIAGIAREAVELVLRIGQYPIINRDVRLDNMLVRDRYLQQLLATRASASVPTASNAVRQSDSASSFVHRDPDNVVATDFGQVRFRFQNETDEQWRCAKYAEDEETAMGWAPLQLITDSLKERQRTEVNSLGVDSAHEWDEETKIWEFIPVDPWYRELSPEEQKEYENCPSWGEHPNSWEG